MLMSAIILTSCMTVVLSSIGFRAKSKIKTILFWVTSTALAAGISFLLTEAIYHFIDGETACGLTAGIGMTLICYCILANFRERPAAYILFLVYAGIIIYITLISRAGETVNSIKINPVTELKLMIDFGGELRLGFLNILLFIPFGFFLKCARDKDALYAFFSACLFSVMIETAQLLMQLGQCDTWDIIFNGLGSVIGSSLWVLFGNTLQKASGKARYLRAVSKRM